MHAAKLTTAATGTMQNNRICFMEATTNACRAPIIQHLVATHTLHPAMIDLHYWPTPNGWKISIMLEECGLPYRLRPVNIGNGEQFHENFLAISPNNRMPAIVDDAPLDGGPAIAMFESGAVLLYLAEKADQFLPRSTRERNVTMQWLMWQVGGLGPMAGQLGHFLLYAPEPIAYARQRYAQEVDRLYGVLDQRLATTDAFVAGDAYSIADMAIFPWIRIHRKQQVDLSRFPHVARWHDKLHQRPAVRRGLALGKELRADTVTDEARKTLFGQTSETVLRGRRPAPP